MHVQEAGSRKGLFLKTQIGCGFRAGAVAGILIGLIMIVLLAFTAPYYFSTHHRIVLLPLYLIVYTSLLFSLVGGAIGLLVWLLGRWLRPVARLDTIRLYRSVGMVLVPAWIISQVIAWVFLRGHWGTVLWLSEGALLGVAIVAVMIVYRHWPQRDGVKRRSSLMRRMAWVGYVVTLLASFGLEWTRAPHADVPREAGAFLPTTASASGARGTALADDTGRVKRLATVIARRIILITIDTLRADRLGCYGYERNTSPNIDTFAKQSVLFQNAYALASGTVPSFMSVFSGTDPSYVHGISQMSPLSEDVVTFIETLADNGYKTCAVIHQGCLTAGKGFAQGCDEFLNLASVSNETPDSVVTDEAIKKLDKARSDDRIFFWFHYLNPHTPYNPPPDLVPLFKRPDGTDPRFRPRYQYSAPNGINERHVGRRYKSSIKDGQISATFVDALYDSEIYSTDKAIGRLLDHIQQLGWRENTAIILTSDHGEALGERGIYYQHCVGVDESQTHVPLIIHWPSATTNAPLVSELVVLKDVAPTILAMAGVTAPPSMSGRVLIPLMGSPSAFWPPRRIVQQTAFAPGLTILLNSYRYDYPDWALIDDGYKYIYHANSVLDEVRSPLNFINAWRQLVDGSIARDELYRLTEDSDPNKNLIDERPKLADKMRHALLSSQQIRFFREGQLPASSRSGPDEEDLERLRSLGYVE